MKLRTLITASAIALALASAALPTHAEIKTINGVASYPEGYQGTPVRAADEDPFLSPTNAALILIDYTCLAAGYATSPALSLP